MNDPKLWHINVWLELQEKANQNQTFIYRIALVPKLKMNLMGKCFEAVSDIQRELQAVLESIKENDFHGDPEAWRE
jgi:hypothetical protein